MFNFLTKATVLCAKEQDCGTAILVQNVVVVVFANTATALWRKHVKNVMEAAFVQNVEERVIPTVHLPVIMTIIEAAIMTIAVEPPR